MPFAAGRIAVDEVDASPTRRRAALRGAGACRALDIVLHRGKTGLDRLAAVFVDETQDLALADLRWPRACAWMSPMIEAGSRVLDGDQMRDVLAEPSLVEQADRGDAQAFAEHVACRYVE